MSPSPRARKTIVLRHAGIPLLLLALLAPLASAHAVLQTADPPPNSHVDAGVVTTIEIHFTEGVEREFTDADIHDASLESWKAGPIEFDETRNNVIHLRTRPLADGLYSVSWKALSVDTHTTRGTFVIAVGSATLRPGDLPPTVTVSSDEDVFRDGFSRFSFYSGLFLVGGMPLFALVVSHPAVWMGRSRAVGSDRVDDAPSRSLFLTAAVFGVVGVAGAFVGLLFLGARAELGALGAVATAPGRSFVARGLLVALGASAVTFAAMRPAHWRPAAWLAVAAGVAACVATALGSHAASARENTTLMVAADAAHLLAAMVWLGGIVAFLHSILGRSALDVSQLVFRFGWLAVPSVVVLLATGTAASLVHMPCFDEGASTCVTALRTERYMQLVAAKVLLMVPLIALGAVNKVSVGPRLARGAWSPATFRRIVQAEALLMAIIVGAAGVLAASSPPDEERETIAPPAALFEAQNTTAKSHVILQISPNPVTVGLQRLVVVVHPLGPTLPNGTLVALKVWHTSEPEPELTLNPEKVTPNEWEIEDALFTSEGTWRVMVILQRPDEYVKLVFDVPVVSPAAKTAS